MAAFEMLLYLKPYQPNDTVKGLSTIMLNSFPFLSSDVILQNICIKKKRKNPSVKMVKEVMQTSVNTV